MRILALETAEMAGSVAVLEGQHIVATRDLKSGQRTAQTLAPAIREVLAEVGWRPADVELVAVSAGPGSFTGLRLGVTTAKAFAYAAGSSILGVNTLEVIAHRVPQSIGEFTAVMDAQRQQLFAATFVRNELQRLVCTVPTQLVDQDAWLESLTPGSVVTGPGLQKLANRLPAGITAVDPTLWAPTAVAVGQVADQAYQAGSRDDPFTLVPAYYRRTAAEEQWERRHQAGASNESSERK